MGVSLGVSSKRSEQIVGGHLYYRAGPHLVRVSERRALELRSRDLPEALLQQRDVLRVDLLELARAGGRQGDDPATPVVGRRPAAASKSTPK